MTSITAFTTGHELGRGLLLGISHFNCHDLASLCIKTQSNLKVREVGYVTLREELTSNLRRITDSSENSKELPPKKLKGSSFALESR